MSRIKITVGKLRFYAELEEKLAPRTCAAFRRLLPFRRKLIQARWSGESAWIPLGAMKLGLPPENETTSPSAGELLLYEGDVSETEILFPYGMARFACKAGPLAGNAFLKVTDGVEHLAELGRLVLHEGAQDIAFDAE